MRKFAYYVKPEDIKEFLVKLGYETKVVYDRDGSNVIGFTIVNTAIRVGYGTIINGEQVGLGTVSMLITSKINENEANQSLKLYQSLYRHFRERSNT